MRGPAGEAKTVTASRVRCRDSAGTAQDTFVSTILADSCPLNAPVMWKPFTSGLGVSVRFSDRDMAAVKGSLLLCDGECLVAAADSSFLDTADLRISGAGGMSSSDGKREESAAQARGESTSAAEHTSLSGVQH